jgi:hypothetical protein
MLDNGQINDTVNSFSSYSNGPHGHCCMVNQYPTNNFPTSSCRYGLSLRCPHKGTITERGQIGWTQGPACK